MSQRNSHQESTARGTSVSSLLKYATLVVLASYATFGINPSFYGVLASDARLDDYKDPVFIKKFEERFNIKWNDNIDNYDDKVQGSSSKIPYNAIPFGYYNSEVWKVATNEGSSRDHFPELYEDEKSNTPDRECECCSDSDFDPDPFTDIDSELQEWYSTPEGKAEGKTPMPKSSGASRHRHNEVSKFHKPKKSSLRHNAPNFENGYISSNKVEDSNTEEWSTINESTASNSDAHTVLPPSLYVPLGIIALTLII